MSADRLTREEAAERAARISGVTYRIHLELEEGSSTYRGETVVEFGVEGSGDTFLDFSGGEIEHLEVNGVELPPDRRGSRIRLPGGVLEDENRIRVAFRTPYDRHGEGLHHFTDPEDGREYLYTQFEPFMAHRVFPCFDQPDLKATYRLVADAPAAWEVVSNGREDEREDLGDGRSRRRFEETLPFSTYLVALVAGPYRSVRDRHGDLPMALYCRVSDAAHLDPGEIFEITAQGMDFYADFFDRPYPFTKYDQLFVPEFNWGGMENVGAVTYADRRYIFRDRPTTNERLLRAEVLLHELAHMWFGDLVTMRWWDDLWLNESFATYMAYLATEAATGFEGAWQLFLSRMKVWAYHEDELVTAHRIADRVPSTDETFLNFDGLTYGKGASALKQLVAAVGMDAFRRGMRLYFRRHAFGNAGLADFLVAIQEGSGLDLERWSELWLETPGLNRIGIDRTPDGLRLRQTAPDRHPALRPHRLEVALVGEDLGVSSVPVEIDGEEAEVSARPEPLLYANHGDHGYAKVPLDGGSLEVARKRLGEIEPPLLRQQLWTALWFMVRDAELVSTELLAAIRTHLVGDSDPHVLQMVLGIGVGDFAMRAVTPPVLPRYVPEELVEAETRRFVAAAKEALEAAPEGDPRSLWTRALIGQASHPEDLALAARLVDDPPVGLTVTQEMRWEVAVRWAAFDLPGARERLAVERERDPSDRGELAVLRAEASRPAPEVKSRTWERIVSNGYESLHRARAAMAGFRWPHQRDLLAPYVEDFFDRLEEVFGGWEREAAKRFFLDLVPTWRADGEVLELAERALAEPGREDPMLERLLQQAIDETERALACRERASRAEARH